MCVLLIPLNLHINYHHYLKRQIDYQEQETLEDENVLKDENSEDQEGMSIKFKLATDTNLEVSKLILKPTPLSVFATGLESALPRYLGMTRNGITRGEASLSTAPIAFLLGHLDSCLSSAPSLAYWHYCLHLMPLRAKEKPEHFG